MKGLAAALALFVQVPAAAAAEDAACPWLRGVTNADGRAFAELRIAPGRMLTLAAPMGATLAPPPDHCDVGLSADEVSISCTWRGDDFAALSALFDGLSAQIETCLGVDLPPATGPQAHGRAQALRTTEGSFPMGGGRSRLQLSLIEMPADTRNDIPAYHYLTLESGHGAADTD